MDFANASESEIEAHLERIESQARQMREQTEQLLGTDPAELEVRVRSEDGSVEVVLDANARLKDLWIDSRALRNLNYLSDVIRTTFDEANATYAVRMAELTKQATGGMDLSGILSRFIPDEVRQRAEDNLDR